MVFFFEPRGYGSSKNDWLIYMGKDKFENEELIKYGLPHDVWFHVDNLSSAHVYLRLPLGMTINDIPAETLEDCAQLVKANSIQGHKINNVDIVYTPWGNLKKTASMEVGQVSFHDHKAVRKLTVEKRLNDIVNRLNRTKRESYPDLAAERRTFDREVSGQRKSELQAQRKADKAMKEESERQKELRSYKGLMQEEHMTSAKDMSEQYKSFQDYEEDFM